jgi:ubiquitin-protein ligase
MSSEKFVSKDALRRIVSDIKELRQNPLSAHGIYYEHDEVDVLKGRALIIGPADTPYEDGFYLFKFQFPANYPHSPPKVEFCTSDGYTRFNPNLYRSGKVCLSILNTWKGEPWSGCQTISSVLLAMCTILNNEPLLNEPGIEKSHRDYASYNEIIRYKNIEVAIFGILECISAASISAASISAASISAASISAASISAASISAANICLPGIEINPSMNEFVVFGDIMREHFQKNKEKIRQRVQALAGPQALEEKHQALEEKHQALEEKHQALAGPHAIEYSINVYKMTVLADYKQLLTKFEK